MRLIGRLRRPGGAFRRGRSIAAETEGRQTRIGRQSAGTPSAPHSAATGRSEGAISTLARRRYMHSRWIRASRPAAAQSIRQPSPWPATKRSKRRRPCGVSRPAKRRSPGARDSTSWLIRPCRKPRHSGPATATTARLFNAATKGKRSWPYVIPPALERQGPAPYRGSAMAPQPFPILYIAPSRIGDAVLASGLIKTLIDEIPAARFTIVASGLTAPLYAQTPGLDGVIVMEKKRASAHWLDLWREVRTRHWGWWSTCAVRPWPSFSAPSAERCTSRLGRRSTG